MSLVGTGGPKGGGGVIKLHYPLTTEATAACGHIRCRYFYDGVSYFGGGSMWVCSNAVSITNVYMYILLL